MSYSIQICPSPSDTYHCKKAKSWVLHARKCNMRQALRGTQGKSKVVWAGDGISYGWGNQGSLTEEVRFSDLMILCSFSY